MIGKVITFYSYKGGVGRSMAVANIAVLLAKKQKKVLVIDWDLEAPGLHKFFSKTQVKLSGNERKNYGVVDLLCSYGDNSFDLRWQDCIIKAQFGNSSLDILSAGKQDESYQGKVQNLNWEHLFKVGIGNFLNSLRSEWTASYDYIIVDSRTGISDIGDICTVILPDIIVLLFVSNFQNIDGIEKVYRRAINAHKNLPVDRGKLIAIPIPSRDEVYNEYDLSEEWKDIYATRFASYFSNWLPENLTPRDAFNRLFIPYVAKWSFGECLPVIENKNEIQNPTSISAAYNRIAQLLFEMV